jgi:hypothetical protein
VHVEELLVPHVTISLQLRVLLQRGYKVRAITRKPEQTKQLFSNHPNLEVRALV